MTDYLQITEAETDPEAPSTSSLWKRWANNWIAGFEGNAPQKIANAAIATATIGAEKFQTSSVEAAWVANMLIAGNANGIGQIALAARRGTASNTSVSVTIGTNYSGSSLDYVNFVGGGTNNGFVGVVSTSSLTGTWRALQSASQGGVSGTTSIVTTLFQRVL